MCTMVTRSATIHVGDAAAEEGGTVLQRWRNATIRAAGPARNGSSMSSANPSHQSAHSMVSGQSTSSDKSGEYSDETTDLLDPGGPHKNYRDRTQAWWSVGEYLENGRAAPLTHQSARFSLTGNRVFSNQKDELWDLSDSLMELYEQNQNENMTNTLQMAKKCRLDRDVDVREWLTKDTTHGFIRVCPPDDNYGHSQLVPCSLSTTAHKICLILGISVNALHIQLNGDIIRRLDPYEHPLVLQNEYLSGLGYSDIPRIQEEGMHEEIRYIICFYAGKPFHDSTFSRNQLQAMLDVRKGKVIHQWIKRLCVISGTRLLIYKDKMKRSKPTVVQLAKGSVEECQVKGYDFCLRITSTLQGERSIYIAFMDQPSYVKWYRKCKKATDKLPTAADLSNCHLEFLPETIFINDQLAMLNLRHNVLRERPIEEDIYTIGWVDDLPRFSALRSLNLADNNLTSFPMCLCFMKTLVELNIASNKLEDVPTEIAELTNLQALHIHNNLLSSLPDELVALRKLFVLVLAFNRFTTIPPVVAFMTNVRISEVENIIMAGNQIEKIPNDTLNQMKYAKKVDLRLNQLTLPPSETVKFTIMEHLTHLDIRDNRVTDLDVRCLRTLEYLNCQRNGMFSLQINGNSLKTLFASCNELEKLFISPKPEWLLQIDVSRNRLRSLPDWLSECFFLQKITASHNLFTGLPPRLFLDAKKLKSLRVNHNKISVLPEEVDTMLMEEILLHHNNLSELPCDFLAKANKLRVLNLTRNRLTSLPPLNENEDLNKLQELYLGNNNLTDSVMEVIKGYPRMKILHLPNNELHELDGHALAQLDLLQELNISGNQLTSLPPVIGQLNKLVSVRAHSNVLQSLPDFKEAKSLRVLDVGHNRLLNVNVTSLMASQLNLLDMACNAQLRIDRKEFRNIKNRRNVCLVDLTGQNRKLPGLSKKPSPEEEDEMDPSLPWKAGFSETSGIRNKLCVKILKLLKFGNVDEALFAMFDGGRNNEVPEILHEKFPDIIREELRQDKTADKYMKYAMMTAHRELGDAGQRLGASACVMHIRRMAANQMNHYTLHLSNVGDVEAVLCRRGEAVLLTRKFTTYDRMECHRVYKNGGIVTEDSKVNGTTKNTRLLGCGFLYPYVIPEPYINTVTLRHDDEFIIVGNRSLWKYVSYEEAVEEAYDIGNPVVAAKRLQDLAAGYGSKENLGILVVRLNTDSRPSLWRLRPKNRTMSIDDVEAAAQHQARRQVAEVQPKMRDSPPRDPSPEPQLHVAPVSSESIDGSAPQMAAPMSSDSVTGSDTQGASSTLTDSSTTTEQQVDPHNGVESSEDELDREPYFLENALNVEDSLLPGRRSPLPPGKLRPLPNQRYRKKNVAQDWEEILQKRLQEDVKDKEMRHVVSQALSQEIVAHVGVVTIDLDSEMTSTRSHPPPLAAPKPTTVAQQAAWRNRVVTPPWFGPGTEARDATSAYSEYSEEPEEKDLIAMTSSNASNNSQKRPQVRNRIAMFENINKVTEHKRSRSKSPRRTNPDRTSFKSNRSSSVDITLQMPMERSRPLSPPPVKEKPRPMSPPSQPALMRSQPLSPPPVMEKARPQAPPPVKEKARPQAPPPVASKPASVTSVYVSSDMVSPTSGFPRRDSVGIQRTESNVTVIEIARL